MSESLSETRVKIDVELGRTKVPLRVLMNLSTGSMLELDSQDYGRVQGERPNGSTFPLCIADIRANGKTFARGEVCTVGSNFGVKVVEVLDS